MRLRCPDENDGEMRGESEVPGGALNLISTNYPDHGHHHGRLPLSCRIWERRDDISRPFSCASACGVCIYLIIYIYIYIHTHARRLQNCPLLAK